MSVGADSLLLPVLLLVCWSCGDFVGQGAGNQREPLEAYEANGRGGKDLQGH
jgi:hypothetical protein